MNAGLFRGEADSAHRSGVTARPTSSPIRADAVAAGAALPGYVRTKSRFLLPARSELDAASPALSDLVAWHWMSWFPGVHLRDPCRCTMVCGAATCSTARVNSGSLLGPSSKVSLLFPWLACCQRACCFVNRAHRVPQANGSTGRGKQAFGRDQTACRCPFASCSVRLPFRLSGLQEYDAGKQRR
jgi:hypothetical protein